MPLVVPFVTNDPKDKKTNDSNDCGKKDESAKAQAQDFQAQPGPVIPQDISVFEGVLSKEETMERVKELNKKEPN